MSTMPSNSMPLVDAVFLERETSVFGQTIDHLFDLLSDRDLVVTKAMVLDFIAIRWITTDVLRGSGYSLDQIARTDLDPCQEVRVSQVILCIPSSWIVSRIKQSSEMKTEEGRVECQNHQEHHPDSMQSSSQHSTPTRSVN